MAQIIESTYRILEKIGSGGGGNVYLAEHLRLGKKVVLKADKRRLSTPPELLRREVDVLKDLHHPHIPQVYDFFVEDGLVYTVMDYIQGESLDKPLKRGETFAQPQVIAWAFQLLDALSYLHSPTHGDPPRGFIHSDIKPANLMRQPDGSICLIDFNIALALGEESVIGCSAGYASPEHYGLDYTTGVPTHFESRSRIADAQDATDLSPDPDATILDASAAATKGSSSLSRPRVVMPDVRSDIYSVGATLYHLLSGQKPARDARQVSPLRCTGISAPLAAIIEKAMQPNPDLRYQSAAEMSRALERLWTDDPRIRRMKRIRRIASGALAAAACAGVFTAFTGLKRMQTTESWLKLAEYSRNALQQGDTGAAIQYALQAFPEKTTIFTPKSVPQAQKALTSALGVYDLADGYEAAGVLELPSAPLFLRLSPQGKTAALLVSGRLMLADMQTQNILAEWNTDPSALSEAEYQSENMLLYAGAGGLCAYDIAAGKTLWQGSPATGIAVSGDGSTAAGVYKDAHEATVYETATGASRTVRFGEKAQQVSVNDAFANPCDDLFALNENGSLLASSFADGSVMLFDTGSGESVTVMEPGSGYTHFEGGFWQHYFAFSASNAQQSVFVCIDTDTMQQTGTFTSDYAFSVQTDADGVYLQTENLLVSINPATGEQQPLVSTAKNIRTFAHSGGQTVIVTADSLDFYNNQAALETSIPLSRSENFAQLAGSTALAAGRDSTLVRILGYQQHGETQRFHYDPAYAHDEARISADGSSLMLFSYTGFCIYGKDGAVKAEVQLPDAEQVYDQQFRREGENSWLEVTSYSGEQVCYDANTGKEIRRTQGEKPDPALGETFTTDAWRVEAPLHGQPAVYSLQTGKEIARLEKDDYLTYITQTPQGIAAQYTTADGYHYGELLDEQGNVLAELPYLCDVYGDTLVFDYPSGDVRQTRIANTEQLLQLAKDR